MSDILRRVDRPFMDLEIRSDGRTVAGLAVPFDEPAKIHETRGGRAVTYDEVFRRGAFTQTIADRGNRVKFMRDHDHRSLIGSAISLREDASGLVGEFHVPDTAAGNDALALIRSGALDALSIGFVPMPDGTRGRPGVDALVERTDVKLLEVSAVAFGSYQGAVVSSVRHQIFDDPDQVDETSEPDQLEAPDQRIHRARATALLDIDNLIRKVNR